MDNILVSVVIPTYGRPSSLEKTVDSVILQNFTSFEVIVVDDNNPDSEGRKMTEEIMLKYSDDVRVRYIKHEVNKNGAAARNTGIRSSRGKYVAFLDDDDAFLEGHIREEFNYLEAHPEHGGVYCWRIQKNIVYKPKYTGDLSVQILTGIYCVPTSSLMMRKEVLLELNGFDESYRRHQDLEIMLRFFEKYTIGVVPKTLLSMGDIDGKNALHGDELLNLKDSFLSSFSGVIDRLDKQNPGTKRKIICSNYSRVWADFLHRGPRSEAWKIFKKYFKQYPLNFTYSCISYISKAIYVKINNKLKKST